MCTAFTARPAVSRWLITALLTFGVSVLGGSSATLAYGQAGQTTTPNPATLDSLRVALEKYQDPIVAVHDGYFSTLGCITIPRAGGEGDVPYREGTMGVHFLNTSTISQAPDPSKPQILIYEPQGDKLRLVAAEWFIPLSTGVTERPVLFGQPFDGPMAGHHPVMPVALSHYDLHVWLFKSNPYGMFSPTNPDVKCGSYAYTVEEAAPRIVDVPNHR
ncbi:MAG TPA: hypothetical protein VIQ74_00370 [Gemmatimonadaceae bacterium]